MPTFSTTRATLHLQRDSLTHSSPTTGLVHISQLHANKTADVNDVVSLDLEDEVWVKVMDVQVESIEDDTGRIRQRHKIKLAENEQLLAL